MVTIRVVAFDPGVLASTGAGIAIHGLAGGAAPLVLGFALLVLRLLLRRRRRAVAD